MNDQKTDQKTPWWRDRTKLPFAVFLAIGGYFLWAEHQAHVIEFLPWLLVAGCLVMHLFMHGGHGHGGGHSQGGDRESKGRPDDDGDRTR